LPLDYGKSWGAHHQAALIQVELEIYGPQRLKHLQKTHLPWKHNGMGSLERVECSRVNIKFFNLSEALWLMTEGSGNHGNQLAAMSPRGRLPKGGGWLEVHD